MTNTDFLAVDYHVTGNRSAVDVHLGRSQLVGISVTDRNGNCQYFAGDFPNVVTGFGNRRRVYLDAIFARAVEVKFGLPAPSQFDCVRTMMHLVDENNPAELPELIRFFGPRLLAGLPEVLINGEPPPPSPIPINSALLPWWAVTEFNLIGQLATQSVDNVYRQIELPLVEPIVAMSRTPIHVDVETLRTTLESHRVQLDIRSCQLEEIAGWHIELTADDAIRRFLFEQLRLPIANTTANGAASIDRESLTALVNYHPAVQLIIEGRRAQHAVSAAQSLLDATNIGNGYLYPQLDPLGTVTGRFSCHTPNLQALSAVLLPSIVADCSDHERMLVELDYMQMELRVLAFLSRDQMLCDAFASEQDVHCLTAGKLFGILPNQATQVQRSIAKTVNFAIIFGQTPQGLASELTVSVEQASELITGFHRSYPGVSQFVQQVREFVSRHGFVSTHFGRRRRLPLAQPGGSSMDCERALRRAVNFVIQGTAADLNKLALARLWRHVPAGGRLLLNIHDSFVLQLRRDGLAGSVGKLKEQLELLPPNWNMPLRVTIESGHTWADCKRSHDTQMTLEHVT